jgi:hypothetical protein
MQVSTVIQSRWSSAAGIAVLASIVLANCGSKDDPDGTTGIARSKSALARCLANNGATFAESADELAFLAQAETNETASLFASTYEEATGLFVDLWMDDYGPPDWLMWVAQPFQEERSPVEVAESDAADSYVAYALRPTRAERRELKKCTD